MKLNTNALMASMVLACLGMQAPAMAGSCSGSTTAANDAHATAEGKSDIVDTARAAGSFSTLLAAVEAAGLVDTLKGAGPFTVFAPTDAAFAKLPPGTVEGLLADKTKLAAVLTYHVVSGKVLSSDLAHVKSARTVQGESIKLSVSPSPRVNDSNIVTADVMASNGVIHVIDTVLLPPQPALGAGL